MAILDTTNFHIVSADDPDSLARASAIYEGCEEDLASLERLFRTSFHTGITDHWPIWVFVQQATGGNGAANNYGYFPGQFMVINIFGTYTPNPNTFADPPISTAPTLEFNEHARVMLVAELAELFMNYTSLWNPGDNAGEALSVYLSSLLHPMGYYPQAGYGSASGPRIQQWLDSRATLNPTLRQNWISTIDPTDQDFVSFGCGIAFLHYLVSQLNHPIEDVIQARDNAIYDTLAITYSKLTGNLVSQAFSDFSSLIDKHLPVINTHLPGFQVSVASDNLFPLWDTDQRGVFVSLSNMSVRPLPVDRLTTYQPFESVEVKPGLMGDNQNSRPTTIRIPDQRQ